MIRVVMIPFFSMCLAFIEAFFIEAFQALSLCFLRHVSWGT